MSDIVQKLWGFCHALRHDGVDYGDYMSLCRVRTRTNRWRQVSYAYSRPPKWLMPRFSRSKLTHSVRGFGVGSGRKWRWMLRRGLPENHNVGQDAARGALPNSKTRVQSTGEE